MNSNSDNKSIYMSSIKEKAEMIGRNLNDKITKNVEKLKNKLRENLNTISIIMFLVIFVILIVFIFFSIYIPTQGFYFSVIQYLTVVIMTTVLLAFYILNRKHERED